MICPEIAWHSIILYLAKNMRNNIAEVFQLWFKRSATNSCLNNIILLNILGICKQILFLEENIIWPLPWENNYCQPLDGSVTRTKSAKVKITSTESEALFSKRTFTQMHQSVIKWKHTNCSLVCFHYM